MPRNLRLFLFIQALATALCLAAEGVCALLHLPEPYTNPFFIGLRFFDFDCFQQRFHLLHTPAFFAQDTTLTFNYLPPFLPLYQAFNAAGPGTSLNLFLAFTLIIFLAAAGLFARALTRTGIPRKTTILFVATAVLLAFPFWFCFQRANVEIVLFALVAGGLWAFLTGRGYLAAALFGAAASIKMLPFVYLALFLPRRQYRQLAFGILFGAALILGAAAWAGPSLAVVFAGTLAGLHAFTRVYLLNFRTAGAGSDHALLGLYRRFAVQGPIFLAILRHYTQVIAIAGAALFFTRIRRLPVINQFLCLCVASLWLAPISFEYTLIHLYTCLALLLLAGAGTRLYLTLLALLLSPFSEFIFHGVRFGGQLKSLLLAALFTLALTRPIPSRFDEQEPAATASPHTTTRKASPSAPDTQTGSAA